MGVPGSNPGTRIGQLVQWLERVIDIDEVGGSIPPLPIGKTIMDKIEQFNQNNLGKTPIEIQPGWTVKVFQKIKEGEKERVASFEGVIIAKKHGKEIGGTFTIRKIVSGVGVEKIFPLYSPTIEKIEIVKKARVRRAKLYYLRGKSRKETRRKLKAF